MKPFAAALAVLALLVASAPAAALSGDDAAVGDAVSGVTEVDAFALAKQVVADQVRAFGGTLESAPAPAEHATPSAALTALLARYDVEPDAETSVALAEMDALPARTRTALTALVNAFLATDEATQRAFAAVPDDVIARANADPSFAPTLEAIGVDLAPAVASRLAFLEAAAAFRDAYEEDKPQVNIVSIQVAPAFGIDLIGEDTQYTTNLALIIDVHGHDWYYNNAGGSRVTGGCGTPGAAALLDLDGFDDYVRNRSCGVNGGGSWGVGTLLDLGKLSDSYLAQSNGVNGGGQFGSGFLLDEGGHETYYGNAVGVNGGAYLGAGALIDVSGNDRYRGDDSSTTSEYVNGGSTSGVGLLLDMGGTDYYSENGGRSWVQDDSNLEDGTGARYDTEVVVPSATLIPLPSGPPEVGEDGDGDGVPGLILVPRCTAGVGPDGHTCESAQPFPVSVDEDDSDPSRPLREPQASGGAYAGCSRDGACVRLEVLPPAGDEVTADETVSAADATDAAADATGTRPASVGPGGVTLTRPTGASVEPDPVVVDAGLVALNADGAGVSYADEDTVRVLVPVVGVTGFTEASAEAGAVNEPGVVTKWRQAVPAVLPGESTHALPSVEV